MAFLQLRDGTQLYYEFYGSADSPPVVFLHGYACTGRDWEPAAAALANTYRSLVFDFRGHDRSSDCRGDCTLTTLVMDTAQVLDLLNLHAVVLVGHSMGGMVGLEFALDFPQRVRGLVNADAFPHLQSVVDVFGPPEDPVNDPYGYGSVFDHQTDPAVIARIREQMRAGVARLPGSLFQSLLDFDARSQLARIRKPVRLLMGARRRFRDEDMPATIGRLGYDGLPHLDWHLIDSHHFVMLEQPDATLAALREFLAQFNV